MTQLENCPVPLEFLRFSTCRRTWVPAETMGRSSPRRRPRVAVLTESELWRGQKEQAMAPEGIQKLPVSQRTDLQFLYLQWSLLPKISRQEASGTLG